MSDENLAAKPRQLLLAHSTQVMLTDAIIGLVAKGVYIAAKHGALAEAEKETFLASLDQFVGLADITESIEPLRYTYEFKTQTGELRRGRMTQLLRSAFDLAKSNGSARAELNLLKDYSFTYRELSPLFEMLREARNYYAHNTLERDDMGWNGLIASSVLRILERANFLAADRVEERARLKEETRELLLAVALGEQNVRYLGVEKNYSTEKRADTGQDSSAQQDQSAVAEFAHSVIKEEFEVMAIGQEALLKSSQSVRDELALLSRRVDAIIAGAKQHEQVVIASSAHDADCDGDAKEVDVPASEVIDENVFEEEMYISVDTLFEELQKVRGAVKKRFDGSPQWRGPSSNFLQRAIITAVVTNEPTSFSEVSLRREVAI